MHGRCYHKMNGVTQSDALSNLREEYNALQVLKICVKNADETLVELFHNIMPILTRLEQTFGAEEAAGGCAKFRKGLCGVLRETVEESSQFEKTARVGCHGFNSCCYMLI